MNASGSQDTSSQFNPLLFAHNLSEAATVWQHVMTMVAQEDAYAELRQGESPMWHVAGEYSKLMASMTQDPAGMAQMGYVWMANASSLWQETCEKFLDVSDDTPPHGKAEDITKDRRFAGETWHNNPYFDYLRKQYLMTSEWMQNSIGKVDGDIDDHSRDKLQFYTKQWIDAMAPSNFLLTNPDVLQEALNSNGESILRGLYMLQRDIERGKGKLAISTTDNKAFRVGENLAATPGQVVYENELMQLIQYEATTDTVCDTPLLLVPAWINKFYIFDMQKKNSFVSWLVDQGYTVFMVSWVNPSEMHRDKSFEHYMHEGLLQALAVTQDVAKVDQVHCMGYCLGGTLLATSLAYLHAQGKQDVIASATYLTTMIDFSQPGELGVFIDEEQIQSVEQKMDKRGYLDGTEMSATFSMLRSNNMIWSYVVNNYLLGKEPFPFDLLYWNSDCTRMPAAMHSYYLRNMYQQNKLATPNALAINDVSIDVTSITTPSYLLSTKEDHIAPWQSTFASTQLYSGDITFTLAGSGHIAGVINPPVKNKYGYQTGSVAKGMSADRWLTNAVDNEGSWWPHWHAWQQDQESRPTVKARAIGSKTYPPTEAAPGRYVIQR